MENNKRIPWNKGKKGIQVAWNKGRKFPEFSGKSSAVWKPRIRKLCQQCNVGFEVRPSNRRSKFCSLQCYWKNLKEKGGFFKGKRHTKHSLLKMSKSWFVQGQSVGEKNINWKGGIPHCQDCGKKLSHRGHTRCYKCKANGQRGEKHWHWKGGISKDKTKWSRERKRERYATDENYRLMLLSHHYKRVGKGQITLKTIQLLYEDNIKRYGTLTCYLCLQPIEFRQDSIEHKTPLSRNGTNDYDNLAIAHRICNTKKYNKTEEEFRKLEANNG